MPYDANPSYGSGVFRRRIRLWKEGRLLRGALEDCNHGFTVAITHDGKKVTAVAGEPKRIPFNTCSGALEPLQRLIGCDLGSNALALLKHAGPRANCTHWLDIAVLAIVHGSRAEPVREYDVEVMDENPDGDPQRVRVLRNGVLIHEWLSKDGVIVNAGPMQGVTLFQGFSSRAAAVFTDADELEAALVLQKGNFVGQARRFDLMKRVGQSANDEGAMQGVCFTYSAERSQGAFRLPDTLRDFTSTPEQLLQFK
jgi:hypothetical protein